MKVTKGFLLIPAIAAIVACNTKQNNPPIVGTWELISATSTEKDSTYSTFNSKLRMIKIINPTHFAFLSHDLLGGKDSSSAAYSAGGGSYSLKDSNYTEHLEYYIDREWENKDFQFVIQIVNDTLTQKGLEKVENLGIDRIIVEKYKRVQD